MDWLNLRRTHTCYVSKSTSHTWVFRKCCSPKSLCIKRHGHIGRDRLAARRHIAGPDLSVASAADLSSEAPQEPDDEPPVLSEIFPRIREGNPFRLLGVSEEASFEEVQDARNFLYEAYKQHESSREAIEMAFDKILKTAFKKREKFGFQPPKTGRKTDAQGDKLGLTILERFKDAFEPSVSFATIVNDGSIFLVLGLWAAWQAGATDPTFPMALAIMYSGYKFFQKRKNRNPDGPYFGSSPLWGALGMTAIGIAIGVMVSAALMKLLPLPPLLPAEGVGLFILCAVVGTFTIFFRLSGSVWILVAVFHWSLVIPHILSVVFERTRETVGLVQCNRM